MKIFQIVHSTINQTMMIPRLLSEVIISDHPDFFISHFSEGQAGETCPCFSDFLLSLTLLFFLTSFSPLASEGEVNHKYIQRCSRHEVLSQTTGWKPSIKEMMVQAGCSHIMARDKEGRRCISFVA